MRALRTMVMLLAWGAGAACAHADLTPVKTYNPVNRPLLATLTPPGAPAPAPAPAPAGAQGQPRTTPSEGDLHIDLFAPGATTPAYSAAVLPGEVDLAALFPALWTSDQPALYYAQARSGATAYGPPLVLQPMLSPARAALDEREPRVPLVVWPPARQPKRVFSGVRAYVDQTLRLTTDAGVIEMRLRPDAAPNTVWTIRELVAGGLYDGVVFHRVIAAGPVKGEPFLVQTGDPTGSGEGGPGFEIALENSPLKHDYGVVSLARQPREVSSGSSQFFICLSRAECQRLDGQYTAFAEVTRGMSVVGTIVKAPLASGSSDRPQKPVTIRTAELIPAPPYGQGPPPERVGSER